MKKLYSFLVSMLFFCFLDAAEHREQFLQANAAYARADYADAVAGWRRAQKSMDPVLYKKAEYNISVARKHYNVQESPGLALRINRGILLMGMHGSLLFWQILFLINWFVFIFLIPRMARRKFFIFLLLSMLIVLLLGAIPYVRYSMMTRQFGIVKNDSALYIGPDERFARCGSVRPLQELNVVEKKDRWYKVSQGDAVGWILADTMILV